MFTRKFFIYAGALFLVPISGLRADVEQLEPNYFVAGVRSAEFEFFAAPQSSGKQRQANWCWAAAIQMVLDYHGLIVSQEQVVARIFGGLVDQPGRPDQIMAALNGWAPDMGGGVSQIHASTFVAGGSDLVGDLALKWPLIVGLSRPEQVGHAYVLTAVNYSIDADNQPIFDTVTLRDPWPGNDSRLEMNWDEFQQRVQFIARVRVTRHLR